MDKISKTHAQQRVDRIRRFREELDTLIRENIITLDDARLSALKQYHDRLIAELVSVHDVDVDQKAKKLSLGMQIASFLGALAMAASIFFLFFQFWGRFPTAIQVVILVAAPLIMLAITFVLSGKESTGYFSKISGLVALACFVLNLFMMGSIFNIIPSDAAFFVWAVFAFLLAYAIDARLLLAAGIISLACFLSARMGTWSGCYWLYFGSRPENFFPAAMLLFLVPVFIPHKRYSGFEPIYRVFAMLLFFLPVLVLSNWAYASYFSFDNNVVEGAYQIVGFAASALAVWVGLRMQWTDVINTGNVFFVIFLYTKFFDWWWDWMPKYIFFFIISLTAILALMIFKRIRATGRAKEVAQ